MAATLDYVPARHEASTYIMSMSTTPTPAAAGARRHYTSHQCPM